MEDKLIAISGRRYLKQDPEHSLLVTETGTGLRVSMAPQGFGGLNQHNQTGSIIAPSSAGNKEENGRAILMSTIDDPYTA